ncbi:NupC/NupG family nucleoside CNT transporter [Altericroceibacterium endophyticum]|uniref:NupC/NupG family nucleoside CNT transporter n=1 Tax=Altericroceibacterium endophyticum TaxID=1808508 RepID=A0A6I4T7Z2_9SPHN|nr:nucleoside transporter C-terminal domain-containing protein [Altericroceibacterium endophyticum]MXO66798.1 NupC/NupG family nucleoside CNT transporter [Altericroceibacterium endophyticum]
MPPILVNICGILVILAMAFAISTARRKIRLRVVGSAFLLQVLMAALVLRTPWGQAVIQTMANGVAALLSYADSGTQFLFGDPENNPLSSSFALGALPVIVFFASLVSILYYLGIMQRVVKWVGGLLGWLTGISKVEALGAAANIFVGQSESPLVVRPYLAGLAPSRLFTLMTVGMAGVAGTILAAYAGLLGRDYLPFLLAAAFMSAPGGILMAKIIMPDEDEPSLAAEGATDYDLPHSRISGDGPGALQEGHHAPREVEVADALDGDDLPSNVLEAAAQGAQTGVKLAVAVGAMLLAFVALVALANGLLGWFGAQIGYPDLSFQRILGFVFAPVMYLIGVPWNEAGVAGGMFGTKVVLNEFVAFLELGRMGPEVLGARSRAIVTFALCGFANFSSIAIQMAVTGGLAPNQRPVIARLGIRALAAGSLANLMSAALAGLFLPY